MGSQKDMRRADLAIPYVDPPKKEGEAGDMSSTMANTLPMAAMFTRNRLIGWTSLVFSLQTWLAETADQKKNASTPGYLSVIMSIMSVAVTYMPLFMPPVAPKGSKTGAPAPVPQ
ncbi:hypothetical protein FQN54_004478 [Arachnomyces sp. PD_36]|nr:hypothetical protein FQN54_004478 [Arachnomyces sp. PD_36]